MTLDDAFLALSHPVRRAILTHIARGEATVSELVNLFDFTQPTITSHIKVLERAGLVTRGRDAQFRPVLLNTAALAKAAEWIDQQVEIHDTNAERK
jgi:DNA-binding transcriptional ArsR family regulator